MRADPPGLLDRSAAELVLATLFLEPSPERLESLRKAVGAVRSYGGFLQTLEAHGVLGTAARNLELVGVELPPIVGPDLEQRAAELREGQRRARLTLQRFLQAAGRAEIEVTLLEESALQRDPDSSLHNAGPLDLLVSRKHLAAAARAGAAVGLALGEGVLPIWWHLFARSPLWLASGSPLLCPVRLRGHLHHPSQLLTVELEELFRRRRRAEFEGLPVYTLDPADRLLYLATAVASRAGEALNSPGRRSLLAAASAPGHPLRLGWILQVRAEVERAQAELSPQALVARAHEWCGEEALRATLECIHGGLGFLPGAKEWVRQVLLGLAPQGAGLPARAPAGAEPAYDFRADIVERLPRWFLPPQAYLVRRYQLPVDASPGKRRAVRAEHIARVLLHGTLALSLFPAALLARRLSRPARRRGLEQARGSERAQDAVLDWLQAARAASAPRSVLRTVALEGVPEDDELRRAMAALSAAGIAPYGEQHIPAPPPSPAPVLPSSAQPPLRLAREDGIPGSSASAPRAPRTPRSSPGG